MGFIRGLWKVLVAVKDGLVLLLLLIFFGTLYTVLTATPHGGGPTRGALHLSIDGPIVEQPAEVNPFRDYASGPGARFRHGRRFKNFWFNKILGGSP